MSKKIQALQLKIMLIGSKPPVWRKVVMSDQATFFDLHVAIQDAFVWTNSHLHQFFTANPFKRNSQYKQIGFPMEEMEDVLDERKIKLSQYLQTPSNTMWYEYDFGDSWMHEIKVEQILPITTYPKYPRLLEGSGLTPPEDCGGIGGYYHLLEVLANPKDHEYKNMLEWLGIENGEEFTSQRFELKDIRFSDPKKALKEFEKEIE